MANGNIKERARPWLKSRAKAAERTVLDLKRKRQRTGADERQIQVSTIEQNMCLALARMVNSTAFLDEGQQVWLSSTLTQCAEASEYQNMMMRLMQLIGLANFINTCK